MLGFDRPASAALPLQGDRGGLTLPRRTTQTWSPGGAHSPGQLSLQPHRAGPPPAQEAMTLCAYVGPAPVPLEDYVEQAYRQAVTGINVTPTRSRRLSPTLVSRKPVSTPWGPQSSALNPCLSMGPRQRQDVDRPRHRRFHEQLRRRDLPAYASSPRTALSPSNDRRAPAGRGLRERSAEDNECDDPPLLQHPEPSMRGWVANSAAGSV